MIYLLREMILSTCSDAIYLFNTVRQILERTSGNEYVVIIRVAYMRGKIFSMNESVVFINVNQQSNPTVSF